MRMPRGRLLLRCAAVAVAVTAAVAWVVLPPVRTADVAVPPPSASAEEVAVAYMAALDAHDCDTAKELWADGSDSGADRWCPDVASLGDARVTGSVSSDGGTDVGVSFDLDWRFLHDDGSFPEGEEMWGYLMARQGPDGPWRIYDEGMG